mmetsp:Transcript_2653/g.7989  ORF Transcript_2653/g.7989 Transcript_2653/m.7989 type:complete len:202 (+) Transcript_2653:321-926(+)
MKRLRLRKSPTDIMLSLMVSAKHIRANLFDRSKNEVVLYAGTNDTGVRESLLALLKADGRHRKHLPSYLTNEKAVVLVANTLSRRAQEQGIKIVEMRHAVKKNGMNKKFLAALGESGLKVLSVTKNPALNRKVPSALFFDRSMPTPISAPTKPAEDPNMAAKEASPSRKSSEDKVSAGRSRGRKGSSKRKGGTTAKRSDQV